MKRDSDEHIGKMGNLLVACACKVKSAHFIENLSGIASLIQVTNSDLLKDVLVQLEPEMLLLDFDLPRLNGVRGISELRKLCPETNIIVFHDSASDDEECAMFKAGVRGCCSVDIEPSSLKQMVAAVNDGELWIRRKFLRRLMEQLEEMHGKEQARHFDIHSDFYNLLGHLTAREYEIAVRVGSGESNKQIAYSLDITERTVKAHLTNVFDKLGVTDRLNVALIVSAEQRQKRSVPKESSVSKISKEPNPGYLAVLGIQS